MHDSPVNGREHVLQGVPHWKISGPQDCTPNDEKIEGGLQVLHCMNPIALGNASIVGAVQGGVEQCSAVCFTPTRDKKNCSEQHDKHNTTRCNAMQRTTCFGELIEKKSGPAHKLLSLRICHHFPHISVAHTLLQQFVILLEQDLQKFPASQLACHIMRNS